MWGNVTIGMPIRYPVIPFFPKMLRVQIPKISAFVI